MAEPKGMVYLQPGGAERFKQDTSKIFRKRDNEYLLHIDKILAHYPSLPRENRESRTAALAVLSSLCSAWLSDKKTKVEGHSSFRAPVIQNLHEAAASALRGIRVLERVRNRFVAKKNWDTAIDAVKKIIPEGSTHGANGKPVRVMQGENWLEILDKRHRRGQELKDQFALWVSSGESCTFWEFLEKRDPATLATLKKVEVNYIEDLVFRDLFIVSFQGGLMRSKMSPPLQNMIVSKWSHETVASNADDKLLDTTTWPSTALRGMTDGWGAFVLSPQEVVYAGIHVNGSFHHSSFLCGAPVLASGMIRVEGGRIRGIHEKNGHYRSLEMHLMTFLKLLVRNMPGTDWHQVDYFTFSGMPTTVGQQLNLPRQPLVSSRTGVGQRSGRPLPPIPGQVQRSGRPLPPIPGERPPRPPRTNA